jgi:tRNA threonylcarbamoyladenosine biosynthesis protein TsaB
MKLLAIDTATEALSVALHDSNVVASRFEVIGRGHAERVLPMVHEVLAEAGWSLASLDALAVGRGPGAFTGVRIAVSTVQGLAFGLDRPVLAISDLAAVAHQALRRARVECPETSSALVCLDARMGEVYAALAHARGDGGVELAWEALRSPAAVHVDASLKCVGAGHGFAAYGDALPTMPSLAAVYRDLLPDAADIAELAALDWVRGLAIGPSELQPVYLRDDVATPSGKRPS